jgi:putative copper resistance protein D
MFPAYVATHRSWGPSYVNDLHIGGSIMWVVGDTLMLWPMIPVAVRWMRMEERKAIRIDRELDAKEQAEAESQARADQPPKSINSTRTPSGSVQ